MRILLKFNYVTIGRKKWFIGVHSGIHKVSFGIQGKKWKEGKKEEKTEEKKELTVMCLMGSLYEVIDCTA